MGFAGWITAILNLLDMGGGTATEQGGTVCCELDTVDTVTLTLFVIDDTVTTEDDTPVGLENTVSGSLELETC